MKIEYVKTESLIPYENNPRFNEKAVDQVAKSIKDFGFRVPITINKENIVITGHTRLLAAKKLGMREVPVIAIEDLSDDQIRAYRLVDNKVAEIATWNYELLEKELEEIDLNLDEFNFEIPGADSRLKDDDYKLKLPKTPKSKLGDIYKLGNHYLMCGDSTKREDIEKLVSGTVIDALITDPPYNVDYKKSELGPLANDNLTDEGYFKLLSDSFAAASHVMKKGAPFYIWHADSENIIVKKACESTDWTIRQSLIWVKSNFVIGRQDYQWQHEACFYGWKNGARHYFINDRTFSTVNYDEVKALSGAQAKKILLEYLEKKPGTVLNEDKPLKNDNHPTMKPIKLMGRQINNSTKQGESILDIYAGSGSTMIAAEQLNRKCYLMEIDPQYVDAIIDRYEKFTGNKAEKMESHE
jgi:site-specific DNA-methyltransferase (adenine-specific)